ncbi:MAG: hypothetical protein KatS3mg077_0565 [Candidatus Binatia bacterium]|nr:MAG: hypothetical protein KatS3mg077_0565 [Candidatus Binatia bacterium]
MPEHELHPKVAGTHLALAQRAASQGDYGTVKDLYRTARNQGLVEHDKRAWALLLIEAGEIEEGRRLKGEPYPANSLTADSPEPETGGSSPDAEDFLVFDAEPRPSQQPEQTGNELVDLFRRWFAARGDVYARQWYDARNDRTGYVPVREPMDERVVSQHLSGRLTLGQYLLYPDHHVAFAVIDLDPTSAAWEQTRLEQTEALGGLALAPLRDYAQRIVRVGREIGVPLFIEDTGGSGLHLWAFFAPRVPARRARSFLRELLWRAGPQPASVNVEIFPKQDELTGKGLGNLVKLPLGVHQATLRPSRFLAPESLEPLDAASALAALRTVDPLTFEQVLRDRVVPLRPPGSIAPSPQPLETTPLTGSPRGLAEALAAIEKGKPVAEAVDRVLEGCAVLRELARRAQEGEPVSATALRCLLYSVGLIGRENPVIDQIFARTGTSRKELARVRKGLQSPIGCKRLHEYFPELALKCRCPEAPEAGYATPVLFALSSPPQFAKKPPLSPVELGDWVESDTPSGNTKAELQAIIARLERMEKILHDLLPHRKFSTPAPNDHSPPPWEDAGENEAEEPDGDPPPHTKSRTKEGGER